MKHLFLAVSLAGLFAACQSTSDLNSTSVDALGAEGCCAAGSECCAEGSECCAEGGEACAEGSERCSEISECAGEKAVCPMTGSSE